MAYAPETRDFYDADSHIMELPDFLKSYADPGIRDDIPEVSYSASLVTDEEVAIIMDQGGQHSEQHIAEQIALGDQKKSRPSGLLTSMTVLPPWICWALKSSWFLPPIASPFHFTPARKSP